MPLAGDLVVNAGRGPVTVHIPSSYDDSRFFPLVLSLHGYSYNGAGLEAYFQLLPLAEQQDFLCAYPNGTTDPAGNPFWNATDACCDLFQGFLISRPQPCDELLAFLKSRSAEADLGALG